MAAAVALMVGDFRVEELLRQCSKLETKDQFYLLQRWTAANIAHGEAHRVVAYALELLIRTTDYTADATKYVLRCVHQNGEQFETEYLARQK